MHATPNKLYNTEHSLSMAELESAEQIDVTHLAKPPGDGKGRRKIVILLRVTFTGGSRIARVSAEDQDHLDCDLESEDEFYDDLEPVNWKRGGKHRRSTSANKKLKINPAKTILTRHSIEKKRRKTRENIQFNAEARKENNEEKLKKRHLQRLGLDLYFRRTDEPYPPQTGKKTNSHIKSGKMTGPRGYVPHKQSDHPAALIYELKHEEIRDDFTSLLVDLQHRDLTPEDYDTLLRLDEQVAPKTVPESALSSFKTLTLESSSNLVGELCSICMEVYSATQCIKTLPCEHTFHNGCIDTWLSSTSLICPLDGIPVHS